MPVPPRATVCGLSVALSVKIRLALRAPVVPGVTVMVIVQELPAARVLVLAGQVLVCAKSAAFVPVSAMLLMLKDVVPLLVSVTVCAVLSIPTFWLPKFTLVGFRLTAGAAITPVPLRATAWGLPAALSVKVRLALRAPVAPGVKVRLIVQELPAANVLLPLGQVLLWAKSAAFVPVSAMLLMRKASELLLVRVTVLVALVIPII